MGLAELLDFTNGRSRAACQAHRFAFAVAAERELTQ